MSRRQKFQTLTGRQLGFVGISVFLGGSFLFAHVWWPIQSERGFSRLKEVEKQVAHKKKELNHLKEEYSRYTSLAALDEWAKSHGPWKIPQETDVITISN